MSLKIFATEPDVYSFIKPSNDLIHTPVLHEIGQTQPLQNDFDEHPYNSCRTILAPSTNAHSLPKATSRGRYFIPQGYTYSPGHYLRRLHLHVAQIQGAHNDGFLCELTKDR